MTIRDTQPARAERAAGIPLGRYRPQPSQRTPHPPDRGRVIALSNDAAHDPRRPFWIVGRAADGPDDAGRPWHGTAETLWAGDPPDDSATRIPHPALGQLAGHDARLRESSAPVTPLAVSWDRGKAADRTGVIWFSDGSTLPLPSYLALLHHAGARADGTPPRGTVTWDGRSTLAAAAGRARRATDRRAGAPETLGAARRRGPDGHGRDRRVERAPIPATRVRAPLGHDKQPIRKETPPMR